ncbi:hypothetical protein LTR99_003811 [Exophiala xenobiotica]|uniref:Uncharacterized protein n=1 Tax=Vermiconidia calcicola TaxID=1690605 RepID=A0AAV9PYG0_9PEZI|nr:hypothetical protein H2202_007539 [Exophiala xenobiotica]KAK5531504.1 hypothetical protein LTR25_008613 [Vermiconidia calcicola]KAK5544709.1 hypothetical protein LTR23_004149 [Chaetothyriales sp. CCFEE 6169]KAK5191363.1 hypothetical protein LTR92_008534 [Exophiala xenobiotica]KAK5207046.1 hypothetical protein LTR41_007113 [Exophiala xenobiotica]
MDPSRQYMLPQGYVEASTQQPYLLAGQGGEARQHAVDIHQSMLSIHATPMDIAAAQTTRPKPSRDGIRGGRRADNQPLVYRELPSFPKFDESIPNDASIEEICVRYPNHLRGRYLESFIQWRWTANDIYNHLTQQAITEFEENGIATCASFGNRANFLFKRLDAYLTKLSTEEVVALCTDPKTRPCMMDGREMYGASKLQGKFKNPNATPVRKLSYRPRQRKGHVETLRTIRPQPPSNKPWASNEQLEDFKKVMANHFKTQVMYADTIIDADAFYSNGNPGQRHQCVLKMLNIPVNSHTQGLFEFQRIEDCPRFAAMIDSKAREMICQEQVARGHVALPAMSDSATQQERWIVDRNNAVTRILDEQKTITSTLMEHARDAHFSTSTSHRQFGLVDQAVQAVAESVNIVPSIEIDHVLGDHNAYQQVPAMPYAQEGFVDPTMTFGGSKKRVRVEEPVENAAIKRVKVENPLLAGGFNSSYFVTEPRYPQQNGPFGADFQQALQPENSGFGMGHCQPLDYPVQDLGYGGELVGGQDLDFANADAQYWIDNLPQLGNTLVEGPDAFRAAEGLQTEFEMGPAEHEIDNILVVGQGNQWNLNNGEPNNFDFEISQIDPAWLHEVGLGMDSSNM